MYKKSLRTRDRYIKAAAELDILAECMSEMKNVMSLVPANESDKILFKCDSFITKYKCLLEKQAIKDFSGKEKFEVFPVSEIYFKWDRQKDENYKARLEELKIAIFRTEEKQ